MAFMDYVKALPKVELNLQLEGAIQRTTLAMFADQNEITGTLRHFQQWINLVDKPDYKRLYEISRMTSTWLKYPEDLARAVYDVGVALAKQNVRYAEISVSPSLYETIGLTNDGLLDALNDGRERVKKGWGIDLAWIIALYRDEPRKADDYARWTTTAFAKRGGVVGLALTGREDSPSVDQFERPFRNVEKKGVFRVARAGDALGAEGVMTVVQALAPNRINDAWGILDSEEVLNIIREQDLTVVVSPGRALKHGWVSRYEEFPLRALLDAGIRVVLSAEMPALYQVSLTDEYVNAVEKGGISSDELEELGLNAVRASFLEEDVKAALLEQFRAEYARLRREMLQTEGS
ncbi:hypothetical protein QPK87_33965 [Kamptonema cortianum]|nr:hypothetical protein [Kamptonema cortianum]